MLCPAQGSYQPAAGFPNGGTLTPGGASYSNEQGGWGGAAKNAFGTATASGTVNFEWTWTGPGQPPATAIIAVTSTSTWGGAFGSCADGLGDTPSNSQTGGTCSGTHYKVIQGGQTATYQLTAASATGTEGQVGNKGVIGTGSELVSVTITPVVVSIAGTDTNFPASPLNPECLVGQQQASQISAGQYTLSNFSWTTNGNDLFTESVFTPNGNNPFWEHHWLPFVDSTDYTETFFAGFTGGVTANCTATFNAPDGTTPTVTGSASEFAVDPNESLVLGFYRGGTSVSGDGLGATITTAPEGFQGATYWYYVQTPQPFYTDQGAGQFSLVQLIEPVDWAVSTQLNKVYGYNYNAFGLDAVYPYPRSVFTGEDPGQQPAVQNDYDIPSYGVQVFFPNQLESIGVNFQFETFLVFTPPGAPGPFAQSDDVPVEEFPWSRVSGSSFNGTSWSAPTGNEQEGEPFSPGYDDFQWSFTVPAG